jgi:hypothetical protein
VIALYHPWFCVCFCFAWFSVLFVCFVCVFSVGIVTANRTLYWSYLSSLLKSTIVKMDDVFALINRICQYATGLQAWWTTWRELWGVGRKKNILGKLEPHDTYLLFDGRG